MRAARLDATRATGASREGVALGGEDVRHPCGDRREVHRRGVDGVGQREGPEPCTAADLVRDPVRLGQARTGPIGRAHMVVEEDVAVGYGRRRAGRAQRGRPWA